MPITSKEKSAQLESKSGDYSNSDPSAPLIPQLPAGEPERAGVIRTQTIESLAAVRQADEYAFARILVFFLWLTISKLETRQISAMALALEVEGLGQGKARIQNLRCQLLLLALAEAGIIKSARRKDYRQDTTPLHLVTFAHLVAIAKSYGSLKKLKKRFLPAKPKTGEDQNESGNRDGQDPATSLSPNQILGMAADIVESGSIASEYLPILQRLHKAAASAEKRLTIKPSTTK